MNPFEGREYSQNNHKVRREFLNERYGRIYQEYISGKTQVQIAREFRMPRRNVGRVIHMAFKRLRTATALILLPLLLFSQDGRETKYHHQFNYAFPMNIRHMEKPERVNPKPLADTIRPSDPEGVWRIATIEDANGNRESLNVWTTVSHIYYDTTQVLIAYSLPPHFNAPEAKWQVYSITGYRIQGYSGRLDPHILTAPRGSPRFCDSKFNDLAEFVIWNWRPYEWK